MTNHPRSLKRIRLLPAAILFGLATCCTFGTAFAGGTWLPENISTLGERIDRLYQIIFVLVTVIFFLTQGALIFFIVRYRQQPGRRAVYFHDHKGLEAIWWIVPGAILVWLALYQYGAWADAKLRPPDAASAVKVQILAKQFEWSVRYAGPDGEFATDDDVTLTNQLYIPKDKMILVQMRAVDVIHSFFLPNLRVKQDIVPGTTSLVWFDATKTGDYEIACSELCGLGHYRMRGHLFIRTADEFEAWLQEKYNAGATPADWGWSWEEGV
jgi:cytochrome c oxidase subunit 2